MGRVGTKGKGTALVRGARGTIRSVPCQSYIASSILHNTLTRVRSMVSRRKSWASANSMQKEPPRTIHSDLTKCQYSLPTHPATHRRGKTLQSGAIHRDEFLIAEPTRAPTCAPPTHLGLVVGAVVAMWWRNMLLTRLDPLADPQRVSSTSARPFVRPPSHFADARTPPSLSSLNAGITTLS